jgi:hypothetical protein
MEAVQDDAREAIRDLELSRTLDTRRTVRRVALAILCLVVLGVPAAARPDAALLWFRRSVLLSDEAWPRKTRLVIQGFTGRRTWVPRGSDLSVIVKAAGVIPRRAEIRYRYESGRRQKALMHRLGESEFKHEFRRILQPIQFDVRGGDGRTAPHFVDVVERPQVKEVSLQATPPAYTGIPPFSIGREQGEARLPAGSRLRLQGETAEDVVEVTLHLGEVSHPVTLTGGRSFSADLLPRQSGILRIGLKDARGLGDLRPVQIRVRVVPDTPPKVRLRLRGIGDMVTPEARIPLEIRVRDDHGIRSAAIRWKLGAATEESAHPLDLPSMNEKEADLLHRWEISDHALPAGEFLTFRSEARDGDVVSGPNPGTSETYTLKVVTVEEFSAEMVRRRQEQSREWKRIIGEEEKARDALRAEGVEKKELQRIERSQRLILRQTDGVADRLGQILEEMRNNRIADPGQARRIREAVIEPLRALADGPIPASADALAAAREASAPDRPSLLKISDGMDRIVVEMERILASMLKIESFTEIVTQARSILKLHRDAQEKARQEYRKKIEDLFKEF